jgi:hypothetical protein
MKAPMLDVIEIENQYYVRAKSSLADTRTNVLMAGDTFAVFDRQGNFRTMASTQQGYSTGNRGIYRSGCYV